MPRRHFGIPLRTQPRPTYSSLTAAGAWSGGSAFTVAIVIILMVLGVVLYGLSKIVGKADTATSVPQTTGGASPSNGSGR